VNHHPLLAEIVEHRVFAVVRTQTREQAILAVRSCLRGGIALMEITLTVPFALDVVAHLRGEPHAVVGVGSVVSRSQVREAAAAGARFAVSPHFDADVLAEARSQGLCCCMGGVTTTELMTAHRAGVDMIKVFPASSFGGPAYLRALREPLPFLRLLPTGGVDESNLSEYLEAGAFALGLGGALLPKDEIASEDWDAIEGRARRIVAAVKAWRGPKGEA